MFYLKSKVFFFFTLFAFVCTIGIAEEFPKVVEENEYFLVIPSASQENTPCPLLVAFSPSGNGRGLVKNWKNIVEKNGCFLFASKIVKNGMDIPLYLKRIKKLIKTRLAEKYRIQTDSIIATGVSGGGMASHLFCFFHPDMVAGVISTVGYIHENSLKKKEQYPRDKVCVFLTGPKDFNYKLMKEDKKFLDSLNWTTKWEEFAGGHRQAPDELLDEALKWVIENKK